MQLFLLDAELQLFIIFFRYNRYYVPVAHPRYKREFVDQTVIENHGDNFSRSIVAVCPQGWLIRSLFHFMLHDHIPLFCTH